MINAQYWLPGKMPETRKGAKMRQEITAKIKKIVATKVPFGGGGTILPVDATDLTVWSLVGGFGVHHLDEATDLALKIESEFCPNDWVNVVGINVGAAQVEALLVALGAGRVKVILIDLPLAVGDVSAELFERLGMERPSYYTVNELDKIPRLVGNTLVVCSHGQNVLWRNPEQQALLKSQNQKVLAAIAARTNPYDRMAFFSLEPGMGQNKVAALASAWFGNRPIIRSLKFDIVNRTPHHEKAKRGEFLELGGEVFVIDEGWRARFLEPQVYCTPFGSITVEYEPPRISTREEIVIAGVGKRTVASIREIEKVVDSFHDFECRIDAAEEMEMVGIFGEEGICS